MDGTATVVLGVVSGALTEEVMDFLDRSGRVRVVATAADGSELARAVRQARPDAIVAEPALLRAAGPPNGSSLLAVGTEESVASLREALAAGAGAFFLWPGERVELAAAAERARPREDVGSVARGRVVAVYGPRGGVGTTFVATHLASAFARRSARTVLIDLDAFFGEVAGALGASPDHRTASDLRPVAHELAFRHLEEVLWDHPAGFRVLLAPQEAWDLNGLPAVYRSATSVAAALAEAVVLHVGRAPDDVALAGLEAADRILVVLSLDVLAFRDGRRALEGLERLGLADRCEFVVNRARRAEIVPADVERVFGRPPIAVLPSDPGVRSAQDRGRLVPLRGRIGRALLRMSARLLEERR
jgi:pilus assembly protein CpaE